MRRNERKNLPEFPVPGILVTQETISALIAIVENADKEAIRDNIYKGKYRDPSSGKDRYEVRERLRDIYYNKCAYCEDIDAKPEVEHYRPKKRCQRIAAILDITGYAMNGPISYHPATIVIPRAEKGINSR